MDANTIRTISLAHAWPKVAVLKVVDDWPTPTVLEFTAGPFDCRGCFEAGLGLVDHRDGSACVVRPDPNGGF